MARKTAAKKPNFDDVAIKELTLAYKRINGAPAKRLQWLLNLSELDLEALSEDRPADLRWEVVVFGLGRKPEQLTRDREDRGSDRHLETRVPRYAVPCQQAPALEI
jgi:hypothetical protein